ncbi:MAG: hypothetical protein ACO2Z9_10980 [Crocinitomicaceae bacterium]
MNRFINALLLFIYFPTLLITIFVGFDLPIQILRVPGSELPYKEYIFMGLGILILMVNIRRSIRRWMGMRIVGKVKRFKWNFAVSQERKSRVFTYLVLEGMILAIAGAALYIISKDAWMPALALVLPAIDNLAFLIIGKQRDAFRVGLSSKALIVADRDVTLLYFTGLRKVSIHQQTIYFDYIKDLQLSFPLDCIQPDMKDAFFAQLKDQVNTDKVFFSKVS